MKIRVLGSAAGGGFPQWNCCCDNCAGYRNKSMNAFSRTQSSLAIKADKTRWILLNASPDIRQQLENYPDMYPQQAKRENCFAAIILVDSQIDHTTGLLSLREASHLDIYSTAPVYYDLTHEFPLINMLSHYGEIKHHLISCGNEHSFLIHNYPHLKFTAVALEGLAPPYSMRRQTPTLGENIALLIEDKETRKKLFFAPGVAIINDALLQIMAEVDCLLIDGTFWYEDEMIRKGVGYKKAEDMGHIPLSGPNGLIHILNKLSHPRKILIHINNTNPILCEDSNERHILSNNHIEIAFDGMEITL